MSQNEKKSVLGRTIFFCLFFLHALAVINLNN